jgi:hypothetical protein
VVLDISLSLSNPLSFLLFSWLFIDRFVFLLFQRVRLDWPVLAPGFLKECGMRELRCYPSNMFLSDEILNFSFLQVFSSPMEQILERLRAFGEFEVRKILPFAPSTLHFPFLFHQFAKGGGECKIEVCLWDE